MFSRWCGLFILLTIGFAWATPTRAQTDTGAIGSYSTALSSPDTRAFPEIAAFLTVKDELGRFIHGIDRESVRALEDGRALSLSELQEQRPGAQFVLAVNPGATFALRNSQGISRSNFIQRTLAGWATSRQGSTLDDLSMLVTDSAEATHINNPLEWLAALNLEQIDARQAVPSLDALSRAIEVAGDAAPRQGMGKAVLFISPPIEDPSEVVVQNLIARARELGVSVFIWMVPVSGAYYPVAEKQYQELASQTGGKMFTFSDEQPTLDLENILDPLRSVYKLSYNSQIRSPGSHQLAIDIQGQTETVTTPPQTFDFNILPPEPAFVSPALEIRREAPVDKNSKIVEEAPLEEYLPKQQEIQMLVAFPDERTRPLTRASLFVDGTLVQENRQAPFERFTWDLTALAASGNHTLRVEVEDSLGMVGTSIEHVVQLIVEPPARSPWAWVFRNAPALSILGAILAGGILLLVLLLGGRLRPHPQATQKTAGRKSDPVTQPVPIKSEAPARRLSGWANRIHWPQRNIPPQAYAFLNRISDAESRSAEDLANPLDDASIPRSTTTPIPITRDEITLGSDPGLAILVLNDPSVDGLHARLLRQADGSFRLNDEGSVAGTWINYTPISSEGAALEHGDLIHIGRVGFRFSVRQASQVRKPVVTITETAQEEHG